MIVTFNQEKAWSVLEYYGEGAYNDVANYSYSSAEAFIQASLEFIPEWERKNYKRAVKAISER